MCAIKLIKLDINCDFFLELVPAGFSRVLDCEGAGHTCAKVTSRIADLQGRAGAIQKGRNKAGKRTRVMSLFILLPCPCLVVIST